RCDVNKIGDLRVIARFRYHHSSVGMSYEHHLAVQTVYCRFCDGDVVGQGFGRVLDDQDVVAVFLENAVNARPSRTIHETTVDENNGLAVSLIPLLCIHNDCFRFSVCCLFSWRYGAAISICPHCQNSSHFLSLPCGSMANFFAAPGKILDRNVKSTRCELSHGNVHWLSYFSSLLSICRNHSSCIF